MVTALKFSGRGVSFFSQVVPPLTVLHKRPPPTAKPLVALAKYRPVRLCVLNAGLWCRGPGAAVPGDFVDSAGVSDGKAGVAVHHLYRVEAVTGADAGDLQPAGAAVPGGKCIAGADGDTHRGIYEMYPMEGRIYTAAAAAARAAWQ